ncbi:hypothetical protein PL8927_750052 [Planktothrix serta PCC 8927]|uniref:Uncharacterized protein n=1 Tax=Planktothrix serta PCC 8927 TaxID=671068 RepID=A0A7Z9BWD4_9CYAN|nr:hypothetical protein PL8927_750052 [Planktothrix serta PCC 8927]
MIYSREQGTGNREQGTPEEKTSPSSFATSFFILTGLATAIAFRD